MPAPHQRSVLDPSCIVLAILAGVSIGWLDLRTTEVTVTAVALLVAGAVLGLLQPRGAWRWAVLLAVGIPLMEATATLAHLTTAEPVHVDPLVALVALAFALAGAYGGAGLRRVGSKS